MRDKFAQEKVELMKRHAQALNWYPFRAAVRNMLKELGFFTRSEDRSDITENDLDRLTKNRNELIHRMAFLSKPKPETFLFMADFIGKIILGILRYDGKYLDWTQKPSGKSVCESDLGRVLGIDEQNVCWPSSV